MLNSSCENVKMIISTGYEKSLKRTYENDTVSYEKVEKAALKLQGQHKSVTGDNIREVLGTGSKGTITKYLRQWRDNNGVETVDESSVPSHLLKIVRDLWNRMNSDAVDKITEHKESIDKNLSDTRALLDACKMENEALKEKCDQLKNNLSQSQASHQALKTDFDDLQKNHVVLQERFSAAEKHNSEYKNEIARLHQLLKESQDQINDQHNKLIEERKHHSKTIDSLRRENESKLSSLQSELNKAKIENASLTSEASHLAQKSQLQQEEIKSTNENYVAASKHRDELQSKNTVLENQLENEKNSVSMLNEKLSRANKENIDITISLKTSENIQNTLRETIHSLENKINLSENRCNQLLHEKMALEFTLKAKTANVD